MSISHQSVIRKHSSSKYKNLGGYASIPLLLTSGYMPWGGAAGQNIEHPHTLAILSSLFLLQMDFSFIGKVQFRQATLSCDSSPPLPSTSPPPPRFHIVCLSVHDILVFQFLEKAVTEFH